MQLWKQNVFQWTWSHSPARNSRSNKRFVQWRNSWVVIWAVKISKDYFLISRKLDVALFHVLLWHNRKKKSCPHFFNCTSSFWDETSTPYVASKKWDANCFGSFQQYYVDVRTSRFPFMPFRPDVNLRKLFEHVDWLKTLTGDVSWVSFIVHQNVSLEQTFSRFSRLLPPQREETLSLAYSDNSATRTAWGNNAFSRCCLKMLSSQITNLVLVCEPKLSIAMLKEDVWFARRSRYRRKLVSARRTP